MGRRGYEICGYIIGFTLLLGSFQIMNIVDWIAIKITGHDAGLLSAVISFLWLILSFFTIYLVKQYIYDNTEAMVEKRKNKEI